MEAALRRRFGWGTFSATVNGTQMLKPDYTLPGTDKQWDPQPKFL